MKTFNYAIWREGKHYVSLCLNNDVSSFGESREEALVNLKEALELYYEDSTGEYTSIAELSVGEELIDA
ncbi:MAG: type II toxin-antitoxin system HicB family antitoxin [Candidatus Kapaibacteriota bacterium]|jgi:predicted RNase H-like HicB family nuclease